MTKPKPLPAIELPMDCESLELDYKLPLEAFLITSWDSKGSRQNYAKHKTLRGAINAWNRQVKDDGK